jgi:hypothetical protein
MVIPLAQRCNHAGKETHYNYGEANIALLQNRNLTQIWRNMSDYAATIDLRPMITH